MNEEPLQAVRDAVLDGERFVEAVFQGTRRGGEVPWQRVTIRPVAIRGARHLQFTTFDGIQEASNNLRGDAARSRLDELLALPFKSIRATTSSETIRVQFSKKGRPIIHRDRQETPRSIAVDLAHDRAKPQILPESEPPPFLQTIGVTTRDGRVRADQQRKFRQINEFLRLIDETGEVERLEGRPIRVVDLGCGSAALTFATYHYLSAVKNLPVAMEGVDIKPHLVERHRQTAESLGWDGLSFQAARIADYQPTTPADVVLALHACDTATDEALARAIGWRSKLIFSAPCCHHHLQAQLNTAETPESFRPVLRHGILRERLGDILTDAFRALILRLMGYRAEVLEFVAVEHTPKNLMIRAVHTRAPSLPALVAEYESMKAYWGVIPYLETLLEDDLQAVLRHADRPATE